VEVEVDNGTEAVEERTGAVAEGEEATVAVRMAEAVVEVDVDVAVEAVAAEGIRLTKETVVVVEETGMRTRRRGAQCLK